MSTATSIKSHKAAGIIAIIAVVAMVATLVHMAIPGLSNAATTWTQKADPGTSTAPTSSLSTENVGKVWTDKTVTTTSNNNFNVTFSALSSAGSSTVSEQQPLDIVLVVDTSGSMGEPEKYLYENDLDTTKTYVSQSHYDAYGNDLGNTLYTSYYTKWYVGGQYYTGTNGNRKYIYYSGWYKTYDLTRVYPQTSASDTDSTHSYFWEEDVKTKLDNLQSAVDKFLSDTNNLNSNISDTSLQHRVALVRFSKRDIAPMGNTANTSQVVSDFTTDLTDESSLTTQVNNLEANGETASNVGFQLAKEVMNGDHTNYSTLTGARSNAKKVVIFFTDGVPTDRGNLFASNIANGAVTNAGFLKSDTTNALVYSIGVLPGVDPEYDDGTSSSTETQKANTFLNAVSSNYPNATQWDAAHLGTRAPDTEKYFYGSEDSSQLSQIYENIFHQITSGSGYPFNIGAGEDPNASGYVTFSDTLGSYMEVKSVNSIEFNGHTYSNKSSSTENGVTTYTFTQAVSTPIAGNTNLNNIIIKVSSSGSDSAAGDVVTVQVPAALMPMDYFDLQTDEHGNSTLTRTTQSPVRLNYTVGMKDHFKNAIDEGDFTGISESYKNANTDSNGMLSFYTNSFDGGNDGDTTAMFTPSTTNIYYAFTSDTPLYTDSTGSTQASSITSGRSYYYKYTYWTASNSGGTATSHTIYRELTSTQIAALQQSANITSDEDHGGVYIKSGTRHIDHLGSTAKSDNTTSTATNASTVNMNNGVVTNALGNNGQLSVPRPGDLQITKRIDLPAGAGDHSNDQFTITVHVDGSAGKTYDVMVTDAEGNAVSGAITSLTFDASGNANCTLKAD